MPTFQYEALNEAGKPQKGQVAATTSEEAIARIRGQGLFPTAVREMKVKKAKGGGPTPAAARSGGTAGKKKNWTELQINIGGVSNKLLTTFTRQFSTLQDAGLPILRSLQILEQQQKPSLLKTTLQQVTEDVSSGSSLSDAMQRHPKAFDRLYTKMIAAGEVAGVLDMILQRLAEFLEKAAKLRRKIIGAMIYPAVVIFVAMSIVAFILVFIVPKFQKIFEDFDTTLPTPTQILINLSNWMAGPMNPTGNPNQWVPGIVWIILSPIVFVLVIKLVRKSEGGKAFLDMLVLKIPIAGMLITKATIAKFTRTLGTLIRAGVPILDAITITKETTGNFVFQRALNKVHDSVRQGESFAEPLRQAKVCDAIVVNMIDVGEETGDLDKMLLKIADNYDDEVDTAVESLVSLLEPIMVVVLGVIVGGIVISLFLPLVKLITSLTG
ncbi:MAG: type II secretion system F family protein [Phycisphaeraceae bacterium]